MDPRPIADLLEHHFLPEVRDSALELEGFVTKTEVFLKHLYDQTYNDYRTEHEMRGVTALPGGRSLEEFFAANAHAFPKIRLVALLRQSLYMSVYAFIEFSLMELCRFLRRKDVRITVDDLRGQNQIDRVKDYIGKVLASNFPDSSNEWQEIQMFRRIRNVIAHNAAEVPVESRDRKSIEGYARSHPEFLRLTGDRVVLEPSSCRIVLHVFRRFISCLSDSLVPYVRAAAANLEPSQREFGEFYIGRLLKAEYRLPPQGLDG